ncbi:MAG TPA: glycosyltransferase [Pyrinomonadaceae bacterium]|jgi:glycosyltransferase involved in cell wall biosynthesis
MKLNIVIPTYNRAASLRKTLSSLAKAERPADFEIVVTVVDNNSTDETKSAVEQIREQFQKIKLEYLFEARQGKSYALNAGIERADGDLLSGVDDDVQVARDWYVELEKIFRARWNEIDFVGGKMLPDWENAREIPAWIEPLKDGVIGWRDYGDEEWFYDADTPMLTGGHAVFKREVFDRIGLFAEGVGPAGKSLMGCEDDIVYDKLLAAGKRGVYCPQLVVYHFVPRYRLSKSYYRQWCFGAGMSWNLMDSHYKKFDGARLFGVPRYLYRQVFGDLLGKIKTAVARDESESLARENKILVFAGFFYARNLKGGWLDKPLQSIVKRTVKAAER